MVGAGSFGCFRRKEKSLAREGMREHGERERESKQAGKKCWWKVKYNEEERVGKEWSKAVLSHSRRIHRAAASVKIS